MMKDKKIQSFSFPNDNDKHLEISVFAVTLRESAGTKCLQLSNKTTKDHFMLDLICLSRIENRS